MTAVIAGLGSTLLLGPEAMAQDRAAEGERIFNTRCASCHGTQPGQNRIGPTLAGVVGRKAGTAEGARYSPSLQSSDIVWNEQTLDAYLANPRQVAPGTTMLINVPGEADRQAVIQYLKTLTP